MKLTHKEFAAHIGKEPKNLYTYLGRKEIVKEGDYYDTDNEVNRLFIEKIAAKYGLPGAKTVVNTDIPEEKEEEKTAKRGKKQTEIPDVSAGTAYQRLLTERVQVDIDRKRHQTELSAIEIARKKGTMIPVSPLLATFKAFSTNMQRLMKSKIEEWIIEISHKHGLTGTDIAEMRRISTKALNDAVEATVEGTLNELDGIIKDTI